MYTGLVFYLADTELVESSFGHASAVAFFWSGHMECLRSGSSFFSAALDPFLFLRGAWMTEDNLASERFIFSGRRAEYFRDDSFPSNVEPKLKVSYA